MPDLSELGKQLRDHRLACNKTAREVAKAADITPTYLWMLERPDQRIKPSKPSIEVLYKIAQFLHLANNDLQQLLDLAGYPSTYSTTVSTAATAPIAITPITSLDPVQVVVQPIVSNAYLLPLPADFVGRTQEVDQLKKLLSDKKIAALVGMGGIGKTTVAAQVIADFAQKHTYQANIVINAASMTKSGEIIKELVRKLGYDINNVPVRLSVDDDNIVTTLIINRLQDLKILLILDDVSDVVAIDEVISLLKATDVAILVISRDRQVGTCISPSEIVLLTGLDERSAIDLFHRSMGIADKQLAAQPLYIESYSTKIVRKLGYHPLAIKLAGIHIALFQPDINQFEDELATPDGVLRLVNGSIEPGNDAASLKAILEKSIDALKTTPQLYDAFILCGSFATHEFGRDAALRLLRSQKLEAEKLLQALVLRSFIIISPNEDMRKLSDRQRIQLHPLFYAFAKQQFKTCDNKRKDDVYRTMAYYYAYYIQPDELFIDAAGKTRYYPDEVAIFADYNNMMLLLDWCDEQQVNTYADIIFKMTLGLAIYWRNRWLYSPSRRYIAKAITHARALANTLDFNRQVRYIARLCTIMGIWQKRWGEYDAAIQSFEEALAGYKQLLDKDPENEERIGRIYLYRGQVEFMRYRYIHAESEFSESLTRLKNSPKLLSEVKVYLGRLYYLQFRLDEAQQLFGECLDINEQMHNKNYYAMAKAHFGISLINFYNADFEAAQTHVEESRTLCKKYGDPQGASEAFLALFHLAFEKGNWDEAQQYLQQSSEGMQQIDIAGWDAHILIQQAAIDFERNALYDAKEKCLKALKIAEDTGNTRTKGAALAALGKITFALAMRAESNGAYPTRRSASTVKMDNAKEQNNKSIFADITALYDEAKKYLHEALKLAIKSGNKNGEAIDKGYLARIAQAQHDPITATKFYDEALRLFSEFNKIDSIRFGIYQAEFQFQQGLPDAANTLQDLLAQAQAIGLFIRNGNELRQALAESSTPAHTSS